MNALRGWSWQPVVALLAIAVAVVGVRTLAGDPTYRAAFAHASGIRTGEEVRVAGIAVGTVSGIELDRDQVLVEFTLGEDVQLTRDTRAAVKLASTLGVHYLELRPGDGPSLDEGATIALANTESPMTLDQFFVKGTRTIEELDLDAISKAVDVLARDLNGDPKVTGAALGGITRLSTMVAKRDQQIGRLLSNTHEITGLVLDQKDELFALLDDADLVLQMVYERRRQVAALLRNTRQTVGAVAALVDDNQAALRPMLKDLETVLGVLTRNAEELDETLRMVGPQMRYFANATGNGPWIDVYSTTFVFPDTIACPLVETEECLP